MSLGVTVRLGDHGSIWTGLAPGGEEVDGRLGVTWLQGILNEVSGRGIVATGGFKINRQGIKKFQAELQKEFDRAGPIRVPVEIEGGGNGSRADGASVTNYYGPVIHGDVSGVQLSWGNLVSTQNQSNAVEQIASGYEAVAEAVTQILRNLPIAGLPEEDAEEATASATEILSEVTEQEPDRGRVRKALATLRGYLAPVAAGLSTGAAEGAQEWAKMAIESLQLS